MERRKDTAHELPAPHFPLQIAPQDAQQLLVLAGQDDVDFEKLATAMDAYGLIAGIMIRAANSVSLGAVQQVRSLRHALAILGLQRIRTMLSDLTTQPSQNERARVAS